MKKYFVTFECHTLNGNEFEAETQREEIEMAMNSLRGKCNGDGMEFYEIEEIK